MASNQLCGQCLDQLVLLHSWELLTDEDILRNISTGRSHIKISIGLINVLCLLSPLVLMYHSLIELRVTVYELTLELLSTTNGRISHRLIHFIV